MCCFLAWPLLLGIGHGPWRGSGGYYAMLASCCWLDRFCMGGQVSEVHLQQYKVMCQAGAHGRVTHAVLWTSARACKLWWIPTP